MLRAWVVLCGGVWVRFSRPCPARPASAPARPGVRLPRPPALPSPRLFPVPAPGRIRDGGLGLPACLPRKSGFLLGGNRGKPLRKAASRRGPSAQPWLPAPPAGRGGRGRPCATVGAAREPRRSGSRSTAFPLPRHSWNRLRKGWESRRGLFRRPDSKTARGRRGRHGKRRRRGASPRGGEGPVEGARARDPGSPLPLGISPAAGGSARR